jgi:hypothetical protein
LDITLALKVNVNMAVNLKKSKLKHNPREVPEPDQKPF